MNHTILVAPFPFKGRLTSRQAAEAIERGVRAAGFDDVRRLPLGDGGGGTLDALVHGAGGRIVSTTVDDGLGGTSDAEWGVLDDGWGIIESARCIGLSRVPPPRRDPSRISTTGIGQLVLAAIERDVKRLMISIGDTGTHDCGLGVGHALGFRFLDRAGRELPPVGASLEGLHAIDATRRAIEPDAIETVALCDVQNGLLGPDGAARMFARQKGADDTMIEMLERGGHNFADVVRRDLGVEVESMAGAGAGGGLGAGAAAFLGARLVRGIDEIMRRINFDETLAGAAMVITGEGRIDRQTLLGKGVGAVASRAAGGSTMVVAMTGSVEGSIEEMERTLGARIVVVETRTGDAAEDLALAVERFIGS